MVLHLLGAQKFRAPVKACLFPVHTVCDADDLNAVQEFDHRSVHGGLCLQKLNPDALLGFDLPQDNGRPDGHHQQHGERQHEGKRCENDSNRRKAVENGRRKIHENELFQLDRSLQAPVEPAVDIACHICLEIRQGRPQQR